MIFLRALRASPFYFWFMTTLNDSAVKTSAIFLLMYEQIDGGIRNFAQCRREISHVLLENRAVCGALLTEVRRYAKCWIDEIFSIERKRIWIFDIFWNELCRLFAFVLLYSIRPQNMHFCRTKIMTSHYNICRKSIIFRPPQCVFRVAIW